MASLRKGRDCLNARVVALTNTEPAKATQVGKGAELRAAVRHIVGRLQKDPLVFGEPLYHFAAGKAVVRQAVVLPVAVTSAVHEEQMVVFVLRFRFP